MPQKKKILFVITDLRGGGAEKILINVVNHLNPKRYEITVLSIFKEGIYRQQLAAHIRQRWIFKKPFKGYSRLALLFSPALLHRWFIKEKYEIIVSFLEGFPSRIVAGCPYPETQLISWIHLELYPETIGYEFRSAGEARTLYQRFDRIVCVAESVKACFAKSAAIPDQRLTVIYNPLDVADIEMRSMTNPFEPTNRLRLVTVGRLNPQKGYDRLLRIIEKLHHDKFNFELHILGLGPMKQELKQFAQKKGIGHLVYFHGFTDPYPYLKHADLFVSSSRREGYSTVVTEAVILGTPVVTTDCSGMAEILDNGQAGIITENSEQALYEALKTLLQQPAHLEDLRQKTAARAAFLKKCDSYHEIDQLLNSP